MKTVKIKTVTNRRIRIRIVQYKESSQTLSIETSYFKSAVIVAGVISRGKKRPGGEISGIFIPGFHCATGIIPSLLRSSTQVVFTQQLIGRRHFSLDLKPNQIFSAPCFRSAVQCTLYSSYRAPHSRGLVLRHTHCIYH